MPPIELQDLVEPPSLAETVEARQRVAVMIKNQHLLPKDMREDESFRSVMATLALAYRCLTFLQALQQIQAEKRGQAPSG